MFGVGVGMVDLRRDLPRNTSLSDYTDKDIESIVWKMNFNAAQAPSLPKPPLRHSPPNLGVPLEM